MFKTILICFVYALALFINGTYAMTEEQKAAIKHHFETIGMECMKEHPISIDDIKDLKAKKLPSGPEVPCFLACALRKSGVMSDEGLLQKENSLDLAKKVFQDEEELKSIENFIHSCTNVNTAAVGDGNKGCERAALAHKCMLENAAQFGFDL